MPTSAQVRTVNLWSSLPFIPIGAITFFILIANAVFIGFRCLLPYPINPWEAGIVVDAWRALQGETIYAVGIDHATHMYGPLTTAFLAQAFEFTGPLLQLGRFVSAVSGIAIVVLLAKIFGRGHHLAFGVAAALLLAANSRSGNYFSETRPDMVSLFLALLALIVLYHGLESTRGGPRITFILAGCALLGVATLFKQTAAAFMFVPAFAMLSKFGSLTLRNVVPALTPIAGVLAMFAAMWQFAPGMWHFVVEVPAQYHVSRLRAAWMALELLSTMPLFLIALLHWLFTDAPDTYKRPQARWLIATLICSVPTALLAFAKDGGDTNSLIPAILSMGAFCAWRTPLALALLGDAGRPLPARTAAGLLFGILLFSHAYPVSQARAPGELSQHALKRGLGLTDRALIIEEARLLAGKVVCPDDPTIPLMAKGYAGRTAVFEVRRRILGPSPQWSDR